MDTETDPDARHRSAPVVPVVGIGSVLDIIEPTQAEQALRESEERLRLAVDAADLVLFDLDMRTGESGSAAEDADGVGVATPAVADEGTGVPLVSPHAATSIAAAAIATSRHASFIARTSTSTVWTCRPAGS